MEEHGFIRTLRSWKQKFFLAPQACAQLLPAAAGKRSALRAFFQQAGRALLAGFCLAILMGMPALAQKTPAAPAAPAQPLAANPPQGAVASPQNKVNLPPSITLTPAVIMAKGTFGQGLTQTLTMNNNTSMEMAFDLEAYDEIVKDGKRVFTPAGETEHSIATTAVFSQKKVIIKPYSAASVDVRLTIPAETKIRAVSALFRGTNVLGSSNAVGMTASIACLITFNLTENVKLEPEPVHVVPATESSNLTISQWVVNTGTEPVLPEGVAVLLDAQGKLVSKLPFQPQRLLPGERLEFTAEYPDQLRPGDYKAMSSFQFEGKTLTSDVAFKVQ